MEGVYRSESSVLRPVTAIEIHQSYFDARYRLSFVWLFDETLSVSVVGVQFVSTTRTVNSSSYRDRLVLCVSLRSLLLALLAFRALTTVLADSCPTALLALIALTTVLAYSSPTALLALIAITAVLAD